MLFRFGRGNYSELGNLDKFKKSFWSQARINVFDSPPHYSTTPFEYEQRYTNLLMNITNDHPFIVSQLYDNKGII